jgi:hypothetical protein
VTDHRPDDDEHYEHDRTGLFSHGDIFRDVPFAYPTVLEETEDDGERDDRAEDWLAAGKRRFLSGPLDFGPAMRITPTCAMSAQGASGYAHAIRTLVVVRSFTNVIENGFLSEDQAADLRRRDRFANYMYLPPTADGELLESVALLYYAVTVHHDFLQGNRITQLGYEGARQLQHKLGVFFAGFDVDREELDPPMD